MKKGIAFWCALPGLIVLAVSGCASYPISPALQQRAQPVTPAQVLANPDTYKGAVVIWGGVVFRTMNNTNGGSLYVLDFPLTPHGRPERYNGSPGQFIARNGGFMQPEVFRRGRPVTIAGTIAGVETEEYQNRKYSYPVIDINEMHVWQYGGYDGRWYWGDPYWGYPYAYPYWGGTYYGPWWDFGYYGPWWGGGWYGHGYWHGYGPRAGYAGPRGGFAGGRGGGGHGR